MNKTEIQNKKSTQQHYMVNKFYLHASVNHSPRALRFILHPLTTLIDYRTGFEGVDRSSINYAETLSASN